MCVTTSSVTDDTDGFDGLRAVVGAGDGVVGRFPGIVCVARCSDPEPLREFLAVCADVAGPEPGRALARRLATWMSGPDAPGPELRFGTVAASGDQVAVYLVGEVDARVDTVGGLALSGAHAAIGTDRLLPLPSAPLVLSMDGGEVRADHADVHDLRAGVVPGAGVVLHPADFEHDDIDYAEEDAAGGHEWFDAGGAASDPFADPPRARGVPAQRAAGVGVGGRNGATRAAGPDATGEVDASSARGPDTVWSGAEPRTGPAGERLRPGPDDNGPRAEPGARPGDGGWGVERGPRPAAEWLDAPTIWDTGATVGPDDNPTASPADGRLDDAPNRAPAGRHALEIPATPPQARTTHPDPLTVPLADPPTDPPTPDRPAADPAVGDPLADPPTPDRPAADPAVTVPLADPPTPDRPAADPAVGDPRGPAAHGSGSLRSEPLGGSRAREPRAADELAASHASGPASPHGFGPPPDRAPGPTRPPPHTPSPRQKPPTPPSTAFPPTSGAATATTTGFLLLPNSAAPPTPAPADPAPSRRRGPRIRGYRCENGHLNDPRSPSCRDCGAPIDERVGGLVAGPRPVLGRLVFDDGAAHLLDGGYLVGRMPDDDERVRIGELRPIVIDDQAGSVSRAHAEIRVSGWDVMVVDTGSRGGTYVSGSDEGQWTVLPSRRSRRLLPGTRVRLGGRMFVFESSSTVR